MLDKVKIEEYYFLMFLIAGVTQATKHRRLSIVSLCLNDGHL